MRIGLMVGTSSGPEGTLDGLIRQVKDAEDKGFDFVYMAHIFGFDAITCMALAGRETERIELGTAVVPTYPRHPTAMAQQSLTAGVASGGRFTLGIGLSHQIVIESLFGLSYEKPAKHMREYLDVLMPLLRGDPVGHQGERYNVNVDLQIPLAKPVPVIIAALGPVMLRLAGQVTDGTITWMTGPRTLESHIVPSIRKAASEAGRPEPRIVAGMLVSVTDDVAAAREKIGGSMEMYGTLPSYRAMLDREGVNEPADVAIVGNEKEVAQALDDLESSGVTDLNAAIMDVAPDARARTLALLESRLS